MFGSGPLLKNIHEHGKVFLVICIFIAVYLPLPKWAEESGARCVTEMLHH